MARLYHKPYRRSGGRRGGYMPASPDPITAVAFPAGLTLPSTTQPAYLGTYTDPYNPVMTVRRITDNGGNFPTVSSNYIGVEYAKRPVESGRYITVHPWHPVNSGYAILDRGNGYAWTARLASTVNHGSRKFPGRFYGEYNSATEFGYDDTYFNGAGRTIVYSDPGGIYGEVSWGGGEGNLPYDEDYVALMCQRTSNSVWDVICVRMSDGAVQGTWTTGVTSIANLNNVTMSARGTYVIAQLTGTVDGRTAGLHVFNRSMVHQRQIAIGGGGAHVDYGLLEDGLTEVACWQSSENKATEYYNLDTGAGTVVIAGADAPWDYNTHTSMRAFDRPGYVTISTFDVSWQPPTGLGTNTVCQVRLATGEIEIWGCVQAHESEVDRYHHQAIAVPSFDGKRVYFNSAWRDTTDATNALMYVIERTA
jgi:hypothetical protein